MANPNEITPDQIQSRIHSGVAAMEEGDYSTALNKFEAARVLMAGLPRVVLVKSEFQYTPDQLDATIERIRRLAIRQAGGGSIIQQQITHTRGSRSNEW